MLSRHRQVSRLNHNHLILGEVLDAVAAVKYLGVTLPSTFDWSKHIDSVSSSATRTSCVGDMLTELDLDSLEHRKSQV